MIFYYFCIFMETIGFCTVFIADINSACKNTLVSVYLLNFHRRPISANFIKGYSFAIQPIFSKMWKFLILLYLSSFPFKNYILWLFVTICSRVSVKISNNQQKSMIFYYFCAFMKTIGFGTVFIADMNSAGKNTLVSVYLLNFHRRHNFG